MNILTNIPLEDLANIGFECAVNGLQKECEDICLGIEIANSNSSIPKILRAICSINAKEYEDALSVLSETHATTTDEQELINCLNAMSYMFQGNVHKGDRLFKEVLSNTSSPVNTNLANHLIAMDYSND